MRVKGDQLIILLFSLATVMFFSFIKFPPQLLIYIYDAIFLGAVIYIFFSYKKHHNNKFTFPIFLFLLAVIVSCFSCSFSWHQNFMLTIKSVTLILSYVLFYLLLILEFRSKDIEKFILFLGILLMIVYFISFVAYPSVIFRYSYSGPSERGFQRIAPYGIGFLFLLSFYSLNRYSIQRKFIWLILYIATLIFITMTLTRTLIGVSFVLSALFILRKSSYLKKILAIIIIGLSVYFISQLSFFQNMIQETKVQSQDRENDIRVRAADYYLHDFSPNIIAKIFGNGRTAGKSSYQNFVYQLQKKHHYYIDDLGYVGIYIYYGFFSILALLILFVRTIKTKVPKEYLYAKYYLYFAFTVSIIIGVFSYPDYIPSIVFAIFILAKKDLNQVKYQETDNS